jgi:hypothetical protein
VIATGTQLAKTCSTSAREPHLDVQSTPRELGHHVTVLAWPRPQLLFGPRRIKVGGTTQTKINHMDLHPPPPTLAGNSTPASNDCFLLVRVVSMLSPILQNSALTSTETEATNNNKRSSSSSSSSSSFCHHQTPNVAATCLIHVLLLSLVFIFSLRPVIPLICLCRFFPLPCLPSRPSLFPHPLPPPAPPPPPHRPRLIPSWSLGSFSESIYVAHPYSDPHSYRTQTNIIVLNVPVDSCETRPVAFAPRSCSTAVLVPKPYCLRRCLGLGLSSQEEYAP